MQTTINRSKIVQRAVSDHRLFAFNIGFQVTSPPGGCMIFSALRSSNVPGLLAIPLEVHNRGPVRHHRLQVVSPMHRTCRRGIPVVFNTATHGTCTALMSHMAVACADCVMAAALLLPLSRSRPPGSSTDARSRRSGDIIILYDARRHRPGLPPHAVRCQAADDISVAGSLASL